MECKKKAMVLVDEASCAASGGNEELVKRGLGISCGLAP